MGKPTRGGASSPARMQAMAAARRLAAPSACAGAVREAALSAFHLATYPSGLTPRPRQTGHAWAPRSLGERALLAVDPVTACSPVILVHGWVHNRSAFVVMRRALKRAGFRSVHAFDYNPLRAGIPELAAMLAAEVERTLRATGAERVQIVGHSLGGVIARCYVQELGGEDTVDTVITLGSPHHGTRTAYLGAGPAARQLRPGAELLRALEASARPTPVRWVAYYTDLDLLVTPAASAQLTEPALQATNVRVRDTGHLSLLVSGRVLDGVLHHLLHRDLGRPRPDPGVAGLPTCAPRRRR